MEVLVQLSDKFVALLLVFPFDIDAHSSPLIDSFSEEFVKGEVLHFGYIKFILINYKLIIKIEMKVNIIGILISIYAVSLTVLAQEKSVYENYSFDFSAHRRPIAYSSYGNTIEL